MNRIHPLFVIAILCLCAFPALLANDVPYGLNDQAGQRIDRGGAKIYYEIYGQGPPVLLLHGGLYGYIDEYEPFIKKLGENYTVIAMATRGHGRSEIGTKPFSYELFAEDAASVLHATTRQPAMVVGFSDGAIIALHLAGEHPELVAKAIIVGGGLGTSGLTPDGLAFARNLTPEKFDRENQKFVAFRRPMTADPARWDEFVTRVRDLNLGPVFVSPGVVQKIRCPVLLIGGDRDEYFRTAHFLEVRELIPQADLAILPHCGHVQSLQRPIVLDQLVVSFFEKLNQPPLSCLSLSALS